MSALSGRIGRASAPHSTGMPLLDAQDDFLRARRAYMAARIARWLTRQTNGNRPLTLTDAAVPSAAPQRLEVVPVSRIVGTLEPTSHFDAHFRPASEVVRHRWQRIALAHRTGLALPSIRLAKRSNEYYVIDGRHRVSVARAFGDPDINAWVTDLAEFPSVLESPSGIRHGAGSRRAGEAALIGVRSRAGRRHRVPSGGQRRSATGRRPRA
jgi:hypothetical protein